MSAIAKTVVTRTVTLGDLTPEELASIFAAYDSKQQAAFFAAIKAEAARDWPGFGWEGQAWHIVSDLDADGIEVLTDLAEHLAYRKQRVGDPQ